MQFLLLIYEDERAYSDDKGNAAHQKIVAEHMALAQSLGPKLINGAGLKATPMATSVRTKGGKKTVHDGPFAETKEQLGGYYLVDVPDLDAAIAIARQIPIHQEGSVEIRPLLRG